MLLEGRKSDAIHHVLVDTGFAQFRLVRSLRRNPPPRNKCKPYPCEAGTPLYWHGLPAAITRCCHRELPGQEASVGNSNGSSPLKERAAFEIVLQVRSALGRVPWNDSAALQLGSARSTSSCCL